MGLQLQLASQPKDLGGGFTVKRLLPSPTRQAVGPFLFMDHFGPVTVEPGEVHDVRPHPHIGLATVTYLFDGVLMHRDSLGVAQRIEPGAINWMTSGHGIVHSERAPDDMRSKRYVNHGLQLWAALPREHEETAPAFTHTPASDIPEVQVGDAFVRVLIGQAFGCTSPVATFTPTLYLDVTLPAGGVLDLPDLAPEMAVYRVSSEPGHGEDEDSGEGTMVVDGDSVPLHNLAVLTPGQTNRISVTHASRAMVLGGEALDAPRYMWWNFVSSRKGRIAQAAQDWSAHAFGYVVGETEIMALPERRATPERRETKRQKDRRELLAKKAAE